MSRLSQILGLIVGFIMYTFENSRVPLACTCLTCSVERRQRILGKANLQHTHYIHTFNKLGYLSLIIVTTYYLTVYFRVVVAFFQVKPTSVTMRFFVRSSCFSREPPTPLLSAPRCSSVRRTIHAASSRRMSFCVRVVQC